MKFFEIKRPNMVTIIGKGIKYNKPKNYKIRFIIYSSDDCGKGGTWGHCVIQKILKWSTKYG